MIKELIVNGVRLKRLPGSDYWMMYDGTLFKVLQCTSDAKGRYQLRKNGIRCNRSKSKLASLYNKLK